MGYVWSGGCTGFLTWRQLKVHVDQLIPGEDADFPHLACLKYRHDRPIFRRRAHDMLVAGGSIGSHSSTQRIRALKGPVTPPSTRPGSSWTPAPGPVHVRLHGGRRRSRARDSCDGIPIFPAAYRPADPASLSTRPVTTGLDAVALMADLGFDLDRATHGAPLHMAAVRRNRMELVGGRRGGADRPSSRRDRACVARHPRCREPQVRRRRLTSASGAATRRSPPCVLVSHSVRSKDSALLDANLTRQFLGAFRGRGTGSNAFFRRTGIAGYRKC